jgi:hypothetical protein
VALCRQVGTRLNGCRGDSLVWEDVGARNRTDFVAGCTDDWDRTSAELSSADLAVAVALCDDASADLAAMSCDEVVALYGGTP